jgi:uncharacterized coiled-coil DUF342 family protein
MDNDNEVGSLLDQYRDYISELESERNKLRAENARLAREKTHVFRQLVRASQAFDEIRDHALDAGVDPEDVWENHMCAGDNDA